ncbi:mechanosensitive ion channel [Maribacter algarum]|uniref:Mechanosensitive ion channel n=1 Tax=Maribacter algarum (ex Zhang et al. 2020) TaxID=2578118 RepID=A0A5S3PWZ7_9FLAO|nr:mechanosensitive ion channel domain-containing protein [Maribacter algarum]TMM57528.1 mechanosensitive ion channel [Maribacter algarum]
MEDFFIENQKQLIWTFSIILVLLVFRFIGSKTVRRIGRLSGIAEARTLLITKYVYAILNFLGIGALIFIWGVNFQDLGLLFSSVFAVIGVALFAQWSILSNVTSGVILFFSFPFKIGDHIRILDKEILDEQNENENIFIIEDIKAFHVHLRRHSGELITYPNNMMLQKAIVLIETPIKADDGPDSV